MGFRGTSCSTAGKEVRMSACVRGGQGTGAEFGAW